MFNIITGKAGQTGFYDVSRILYLVMFLRIVVIGGLFVLGIILLSRAMFISLAVSYTAVRLGLSFTNIWLLSARRRKTNKKQNHP
ncbi:MAG: hypothetical protein GX969_06040 [Firmicutes bacterium]|nr:hypothetical protein [Bacillota bacterium]